MPRSLNVLYPSAPSWRGRVELLIEIVGAAGGSEVPHFRRFRIASTFRCIGVESGRRRTSATVVLRSDLVNRLLLRIQRILGALSKWLALLSHRGGHGAVGGKTRGVGCNCGGAK